MPLLIRHDGVASRRVAELDDRRRPICAERVEFDEPDLSGNARSDPRIGVHDEREQVGTIFDENVIVIFVERLAPRDHEVVRPVIDALDVAEVPSIEGDRDDVRDRVVEEGAEENLGVLHRNVLGSRVPPELEGDGEGFTCLDFEPIVDGEHGHRHVRVRLRFAQVLDVDLAVIEGRQIRPPTCRGEERGEQSVAEQSVEHGNFLLGSVLEWRSMRQSLYQGLYLFPFE